MTAAALARPAFPNLVARLIRRAANPGRGAARPETGREADRSRRAFVTEMLCRNPEAFASEHDVHAMMQLYPGRF